MNYDKPSMLVDRGWIDLFRRYVVRLVVEITVVSLCEFILTGRIGVFVDDGFFNTGGRICAAMSLLAFVVGFIVAFRTWKDEL